MKLNFFVEDMLFFKYIGCATLAKMLYNALTREESCPDIAWNARGRDFDLVHYHTFGPLALTKEVQSSRSRCSRLTRPPASTPGTSPSPRR